MGAIPLALGEAGAAGGGGQGAGACGAGEEGTARRLWTRVSRGHPGLCGQLRL